MAAAGCQSIKRYLVLAAFMFRIDLRH